MIFESSEIAGERAKRGLSRNRLAAISDVPASRIAKIEREGNATEQKLKKLTAALLAVALRAGGAT